ncbi:uncharacterized protein LOC136758328 [Amia ocellicauda]|uniref:uncharacterized protein LOC136758328 n=1 Tax=Amia ocellicauda TaxID=2972642 RepID=UPI0034647C46
MDGEPNIVHYSDTVTVEIADRFSKFGRPRVEVDPQLVNEDDLIRVLCLAGTGMRCFFYNGNNKMPFNAVVFNETSKACSLTVLGKDLPSERHRGNSSETLLSCAVEAKLGESTVKSRRSESVKVEVVGKELRTTLSIEAVQKLFNIEDSVVFRCQSNKGSLCHFYTDGSQVPFRSVPFRTEYQHCHISVSAEELLGERGSQLRTEVSVSCAVELTMDGEPNIVHYSDTVTVEIADRFSKFGRPRVEVDPQLVNEDDLIRVLCLAGTGMRCFFYNGNNKMPFNAVVFNETSKACSLTVLGKDLPSERHRGNSSETLLSCAVEAKLGESTVKSRRSESVKVEVVGKG